MKRIIIYTLSILFLFSIASCKSSQKITKQKHKDLTDVYQSLKAEMPEAMVTMEGESVKVVLPESVLFQKNSADLNKEYFPILAKMAHILNKYDKTSILISGYTDITGTESYNMELSKKRAENAKQVFVDSKVNASRMFTWGRGPKEPVGDNNTAVGKQQNRRVEYVILYDYKAEQ